MTAQASDVQGILCATGSAGIMHQASPANLRKPLKRIGPRGVGPTQEIKRDEALGIAANEAAGDSAGFLGFVDRLFSR